MPNAQHGWIYVSVTPTGMRWPGPGNGVDSQTFARIPGKWIGEIEFETTGGGVLIVPPADPGGRPAGEIRLRDPTSV